MRGPGIEIGGSAVPTSIAIVKAALANSVLRDPQTPIGYYGVITTSGGAAAILNVDDDGFPDLDDPVHPIDNPLPLAIANQLRDAIPARDDIDHGPDPHSTTEHPLPDVPACGSNGVLPDQNGNNSGGPRLTAALTRNVPAGVLAGEKGNTPSTAACCAPTSRATR